MPNAVVQLHRQKFPEDPRSDEELTLEYGKAYGDGFAQQFPDFHSDLQKLTKGSEPQPSSLSAQDWEKFLKENYPVTARDYVKQAVGTGVRSLAGGLAEIPEFIGIGAQRLQKAVTGEATPLEELTSYRTGQAIRRAAENITPEPVPELSESFLATKVPAAAGSSAAFLLGGAAGRLAKIPAAAGVATLGVMANATEGYHEAKRSGATEDQAFLSFLLNGGVGVSEAWPLANMLKKLDGISGGTLKKSLVEAGKQSFEEALQESFQGVAGNYIARNVAQYDKDRKLFDDVLGQGGAGGVVGFAASLASSLIGHKIGSLREHGATVSEKPDLIPPSPAAPDVAAQYAAEEEKKSKRLSDLESLARRQVEGGQDHNDVKMLANLTPEEQLVYPTLVNRIREEAQNATATLVEQERVRGERLRTAAQLQTEGEDRQHEAKVKEEGAADRIGDSLQGATGEPVKAPEQATIPQPSGTIAPVSFEAAVVVPGAQPSVTYRVLATITTSDGGTYQPGQMVGQQNLERSGFVIPTEEQAKASAEIERQSSPPQEPTIEPVSRINLRAIAQDFTERLAQLGQLTDPQRQALGIVRAILKNPTSASDENLARIFGLKIDDTAATMPNRFQFVTPAAVPVVSAPAPVKQTVAAPIKAQPVPTPVATTAISPAAASATTPQFPLRKGTRVTAWEDQQGRPVELVDGKWQLILPQLAVRSVPRALAAAIATGTKPAFVTPPKPKPLLPHPVVDTIDFEGDAPVIKTEGISPSYFEITGDLKNTNEGLEEAGLVNRASVETEVPHGTRNSWTYRWTAFQNGNRVYLFPTYKTDTGNIVAMEPGKKKGTQVTKLIAKGYIPIASFRSQEPVHAIEANKVVMGITEFQKQFAGPARERMSASARTAAAVAERLVPATPGGIVTEATVNAIYPEEVVLSSKTAGDLYPRLTEALALEPEGRLGIESTVLALADYVRNGTYGNEIQDLAIGLAGRSGEAEASRLIVNRVVEAYNNSRTSQEFAQAISTEPSGGEGAPVSSGGSVVVAGNRTQRGTGQPSVPVPATAADRGVAFRITEGGYTSSEKAVASFRAVLNRLALAGVDVRVFQQRLDQIGSEFFQRSGGGLQANNMIALVVGDIISPTHEDLVAAIHETGHWLFAKESPEVQDRLHNAVNRLSDQQLGLQQSGDSRIRSANIAGLNPETLSEERLVESLALEGFDPIASRTLSQRIMRFLKDLWLRVSLAVQESLFGADHVNPERAVDYFRNRLQSFLSGDSTPKDFISFIGGGNPSIVRQSSFYVPWNEGHVPVTLDWENGRLQYQKFTPSTVAAALFDIDNALREADTRYRKPGYVSEGEEIGGVNPTVRAGWSYAAAKKVAQVLGSAFTAFESLGHNVTVSGEQLLTPSQFAALFQGDMSLPEETIAAVVARLQSENAPPINPDLSVDGPVTFENDATRKQSMAIALKLLNQWRANFNKAQAEAVAQQQSIARKLERKIDHSEKLASKYQDLSFHFENIKEAIGYLVEDFKSDIRSQSGLSKQLGVLTQLVKQTQDRIEDPLPGQYENLIDRMARRIFDNADGFMDFLRATSQMDLNWQNLGMVQLRQLIGIRAQMEQNPVFQGMNEQEQNALLALAAGFAKTNDAQMAWLQVKEQNDYEAANAIKEMLKVARSDTTADLNTAKAMINRVPRMARQADRIFQQYRQSRREARILLDQQRQMGTAISAHAAASPVFAQEIGRLETALGANRPVALVEGARLPYVVEPTDSVETINKRAPFEYHFTGDQQATPQQVGELIKRYNAWIAANTGTGGAMIETLRDLVRRLEMIDANKKQVGIRQGTLSRIFNSLSDSAQNTGTVAGARIAQQLRRYAFLMESYEHGLEIVGNKVSVARGDAMKAVGLRDSDLFHSIFHDQAFDYLNKRKDLQETPGGPEAIRAAAFAALRQYYMANTDLRSMITPVSWEKLQNYWNSAVTFSTEQAKVSKSMGIKIQDDNLGLFRDVIGDPLFTMPRGMSEVQEKLYHDMRSEWDGTKTGKLKTTEIAQKFTEDADKLRQELAPRFTPEIWRSFVRPMVNRPGRSLFSGRLLADGTYTIARIENVQQAFQESNGDALVFAARLHELEGNAPQTLPAFAGETLGTFQNYYNSIEGIMSDTASLDNTFGLQVGVPRYLMDARVSEDYPVEWLRYQHFDQNHARANMHRMAFHAAFGRNGSTAASDFSAAANELNKAKIQWNDYFRRAQLLLPGKNRKDILNKARALAKEAGENSSFLENAASNLHTLETTKSQFGTWFRTMGGDLVEAKVLLEGLSMMAGLMVQGPKTAIINTIDIIGGPVLQYGLNKTAVKQIARSWQSFFNGAFGSLFQTFSYMLQTNAEYTNRRNRLGFTDTDRMITLKDRIKGELNAELTGGPVTQGVIRASRILRLLTSVGLPSRASETRFSTLKPQALFTQIGRWMNEGLIDGTWFQFEGLVDKAKRFLADHPDAVNDPSFKFTADDLGFKKGIIFDNEQAFDALNEALNRWGMSLEGVARNAMKPNAPLFTDDQYRALAMMALSEISLESNPTTRPRWFGNPIIRFAAPLLGWGFSKTEQIRKAFVEPNGESSKAAMWGGMKSLMAVLPLGLAYAFLMDKYDDKITGKKSNIRGFGQDNNFLAAIEQMARMGNLGLWGDLANTIGNYAGKGDLRGLSVDNRVVFMNSFLSVASTLTTLMKQEAATYSTVYRPLLQSIGGGGYLQYAQIINNLLSLDTAESRVTSRININNWLRAVGREMEMDVRTGRGAGAYVEANSIKPWVGEMLLASLADDQAGFNAAYQRALDAARKEGKPDPKDHVQRSYASYNPLRTVFQTPPSEAEYRQLLARLPDSGRDAVRLGLLLFNKYGEQIGANEYFGREDKAKKIPIVFRPKTAGGVPTVEQIRSRAMNALYPSSTFSR